MTIKANEVLKNTIGDFVSKSLLTENEADLILTKIGDWPEVCDDAINALWTAKTNHFQACKAATAESIRW